MWVTPQLLMAQTRTELGWWVEDMREERIKIWREKKKAPPCGVMTAHDIYILRTFKEPCCEFVICRMSVPQSSWFWSWISESGSDHLLQPGPVHWLVLLLAPEQSPAQQPGLRVGASGWNCVALHPFLKSWFIMVWHIFLIRIRRTRQHRETLT